MSTILGGIVRHLMLPAEDLGVQVRPIFLNQVIGASPTVLFADHPAIDHALKQLDVINFVLPPIAMKNEQRRFLLLALLFLFLVARILQLFASRVSSLLIVTFHVIPPRAFRCGTWSAHLRFAWRPHLRNSMPRGRNPL